MSLSPQALSTPYWQAVHKTAAELTSQTGDDCFWITSIENQRIGMRGGVTQGVSKRIAAISIVNGTHRVATDAEIADALKRQKERAEVCAVMSEKLQRKSVLLVDRRSLKALGEVE